MTAQDFTYFIHTYRLFPKPDDIGHLLTYIRENRLLWHPKTAVPVAGVIIAFCDLHPEKYEAWKQNEEHHKLLTQAFSISRARGAQESIEWVEYLVYRWIILATDYEAWQLMKIANEGPNEVQKMGAQAAIDKVIRSFVDGVPVVTNRGEVVSKTDFEDLRLQMLRLAREYSRMTPAERRLPFGKLPFTSGTREIQTEQASRISLAVQ